MSISIESFVNHRIGLSIPEFVVRDAIAHMLMSYLREELKGAHIEDLLDDHRNLEEAQRRLQSIAKTMILPQLGGDLDAEGGRRVEIPFSFTSQLPKLKGNW